MKYRNHDVARDRKGSNSKVDEIILPQNLSPNANFSTPRFLPFQPDPPPRPKLSRQPVAWYDWKSADYLHR
jgi:hypothetical protein